MQLTSECTAAVALWPGEVEVRRNNLYNSFRTRKPANLSTCPNLSSCLSLSGANTPIRASLKEERRMVFLLLAWPLPSSTEGSRTEVVETNLRT